MRGCGLLQQAMSVGCAMLGSAIFFLVVAIVAALFGFTGVSAAGSGVAKLLFYLSLALFVLALVVYVVKDHPPRS